MRCRILGGAARHRRPAPVPGAVAANGSAQFTITIPSYRLNEMITLQAAVRASQADTDPADNADSEVDNVDGSFA